MIEGPTNRGQPAEIGDSCMSEEDIRKLTPPERDLHYARIQHRKENINTEIKLNLRKADGEWKGKDEDPMTMVLIELRVWQLILRDLEEERRADEITRNRIEQGNEPGDSSSDSSDDDDDANDGKEFIRTDVKKFGQRDISAEDLQKLEPWERKLHFALIEHMKDYLDIEMKHKYRDGDAFWRGRGPEPTMMSLRALKAWQIEMDKRESGWMDQVMAGERAWSDDVASDTSFNSEYDIGDGNMSNRYFEWLGDEDKERHLALVAYTDKFRSLEYELGFRDRTTFQWIAMTMDPVDMNLGELDQWTEDMNEMGCEWEDKKEAEEAAAAAAANTNTTQPTTETETQSQPRLRSPEGLEMEEMMEERRRMGLDPLGDSPEARRWRAMMAAKAEAERQEAERLAAERESDGPGDQLRTEEAARAKTAQNSRRSAGESTEHIYSKEKKESAKGALASSIRKSFALSLLVAHHHVFTMAAPSKQRAYSPYPANAPHRSFPPQYHTSYTSQYHASTPTSAPAISPFPPSYDGHAKLSPDVFGTYTSPSPHDLPLFNTELHAHQLSLQEKGLSYQQFYSPSSSEGETYGSSSPTYTPFPPNSTPTTPSPQTPQHHACHSTNHQPWAAPNETAESSYPCTPTAFTGYDESTPVHYLSTTSPATNTPILLNVGERQEGYYIGTPSTPPPPLYPHVSSPDLTTPTSAAIARYRNAQDNTPLTPLYFHVSSPVMTSPMSEGSEFGGALVHEPENKEASEEVRRLMADREGRSRFPGSLGGWGGFETAVGEERMMPGGGGNELVSPRNTMHGFESQSPAVEKRTTPGQAADEFVSPRTNSHGFETQETPLLAGTPTTLGPAYSSPLTSPP
ncbi:hypothetical protein V500_05973, partial [Pseudogymnoascus sp. VKM F-4518 (FW-2643)]